MHSSGNADAVEHDVAFVHGNEACQGFGQRELAVARDAGDAKDLSGGKLERDIADGASLSCRRKPAHLKQGDVRCWRRGPRQRSDNAASNHGLHQGLGRPLVGAGLVDHLAAAHHHDAIGAGGDVGKLVGDEHHGLAFRGQRADEAIETLALGRRQHRGRFVQDHHAGIEIEDLCQFDQLSFADAEAAHRPRWVYIRCEPGEPA